VSIKILRSEVTATPPSLLPGQLAYSELSGTLFIGLQAGTVLAIGGSLFAKLASPAFTGSPTVPTQSPGDNSTKAASTAYVDDAVASAGGSSVWGGITGTLSSQTDLVAALDAKAALASPTFTGTPAAPTASGGTNTTQLATTAFVQAAIAAILDSAPGTLDTLNELAAALGDDPAFATTSATSLGEKLVKASNLADLTNTATARSNLGLASMAQQAASAVAITGGTIGSAVVFDDGTF
jgi:hypothetical protein